MSASARWGSCMGRYVYECSMVSSVSLWVGPGCVSAAVGNGGLGSKTQIRPPRSTNPHLPPPCQVAPVDDEKACIDSLDESVPRLRLCTAEIRSHARNPLLCYARPQSLLPPSLLGPDLIGFALKSALPLSCRRDVASNAASGCRSR